jgi:CHASE1-domain containing sensor protein
MFFTGLRVNDHAVILQAYQKPRSTAVQIARIAAVTVVLVSFVLGAFMLAAAWIEANAYCQQQAQFEALAVAQVSA